MITTGAAMREDRRVGRLHVLTDECLQHRFSHQELAGLAADGGADTVQFREKRTFDTQDLIRRANAMTLALKGTGVRLCINDHVEVARAVGADAVHLGAQDMTPAAARQCLGPGAWIGVTANSLEQALALDRQPVDYLGVGPVFGTRSKSAPAPRLGLEALRCIVSATSKPVIAIGSIRAALVRDVLETGAHGIAILSAVVCDRDPAQATADFAEAIRTFVGDHADEQRTQRTG